MCALRCVVVDVDVDVDVVVLVVVRVPGRKAVAISASNRSWSAFRNPFIVSNNLTKKCSCLGV
jgi:hypothetical protein